MATPIATLAASISCFGLALYSSSTTTEILLQVASLAMTAISFSTSGQFPDPLNSTWALMMAVWTSHSMSLLWLEPRQEYQKSHPKAMSAWRVWNNPRLIGLPGQVVRSPGSPYRRSSTTFVILKLGKAAVCILAYSTLLPLVFSPSGIPARQDDFDTVHTTFFRRLLPGHSHPATWHEAQVRCVWAALWALGPYLTLEAAHSILAVLFVVVLRFDEPSDWPPLFGSLSESYSIRRFWSQFWHRLIMRPYTNIGKLFSRQVIGLPARSEWDGLVVPLTVFTLSGAAHAAAAAQLGDNQWALDVVWFVGCFAAGAFEAIASKIWCCVRKEFRNSLPSYFSRRMDWYGRAAGFLWVFLFFFWSVPKWQYPKLDRLIQSELQQMAMQEIEART